MKTLYSYFRSSAAYRVRIALALKGLSYETIPVHLLRDGGEQFLPAFRRQNPESLVPVLVDEGQAMSQSLAIIEYLDEAYGPPALLPAKPLARARVRALALHIACDIHPLNNLRVLRYLSNPLAVDKTQRDTWYRHWVSLGFAALEVRLQSPDTQRFCHGDTPTMADCCLIPQVYNARRLDMDLSPYPTIRRIDAACAELAAFQSAAPEAQADAPASS